jgi:S-adenosyl-L-methionine hydrolase (adenosine-forming)
LTDGYLASGRSMICQSGRTSAPRVTGSPKNSRFSAGRILERERTFSDRPPGSAFWYENSNGLAEIAVNQGRADRDLGLTTGIPVEIVP